MISLDTNVLVRVVTRDDPKQLPIAVELMQQNRLFVTKTVLLELEWVLRYTYELPHEAVLSALRTIMGYPNLQVEDRVTVLIALEALSEGMDFADALHVTSSSHCDAFATFDRPLAQKAQALNLEPSVEKL